MQIILFFFKQTKKKSPDSKVHQIPKLWRAHMCPQQAWEPPWAFCWASPSGSVDFCSWSSQRTVSLASLTPIKPPTHTRARPFLLLFPPFLLPTFSPGEAPPPPAQSWASAESLWPKTTVKTTRDTSWVSQAFAGWSKSPDHPQGQHCFYREVTTWTKSIQSTPWPKLRTAHALVSLEQLTLLGFGLNQGVGRSSRSPGVKPSSAGPKEKHGKA